MIEMIKNWTLSDWASVVGIAAFLISFISIAFSARHYILIQRREQGQRMFENYHKILKAIASGEEHNTKMKLVSQMGYIFELRNFKEYKDISERSLINLFRDWRRNDPRPENNLLKNEITLTLEKLGYKKEVITQKLGE